MKIPGKDFMITIDVNGTEVPICHATDCIIDKQYGTLETSGPQGYWRDYIGEYAGYTIQVPGLVVYTESVNWVQLEQWADARTKLKWYATAFDNGGVVHSGTMLITNLNLTSQMRDVMKFEMSAIGCGAMVTAQLPISSTVYLADENKIRLAGCPNPYPVGVYWYGPDGNSIGVFLGIALNSDDVINWFNNYEGNEYYELTGATSGCDFNLLSAWNAPFVPTVIFAQPTPELGMWSGTGDEGISPDQINDELLSPAYS